MLCGIGATDGKVYHQAKQGNCYARLPTILRAVINKYESFAISDGSGLIKMEILKLLDVESTGRKKRLYKRPSG